ncbi:hypothetical protein [Polaromonas sp.]|uniref:hypothetical protein n=1 Tax=Polaromonas sp. TaxID=1869339 RepID=UPI0013BD900D|nr:hypothetical protein [Polaromonas sp.]NDP63259.1 hypothetical protein [Polaromonas sp.]
MMRALYTVTVLELFLGGGGRLLEFGPVTLRMVLFVLCICASMVLLVFHKNKDGGAVLFSLGVSVVYMLVHGLGFFNGAVKGADWADLLSDTQPSLYWMLAPFFAIMLGSVSVVRSTATMLCMSGVVLAIIYLISVVGLWSGILEFDRFYQTLDSTGEFFFRGENFFFYKGFLYLAISSVFLMFMKGRLSSVALLLVIVALTLTLTRGFVISTAAAIIFMLFGLRRWKSLALAFLLTFISGFFVWFYLPGTSAGFSEQREISNNVRLNDLSFMLENASVSTLIIGEGFGSYINERLNIENSFLWIGWKLGVAGLMFWLFPLITAFIYYHRIDKNDLNYNLGSAFFYSILLVYIQTGSNPFLNNPIGLSFVLISLFSLRTLANFSDSREMTGKPITYFDKTGVAIL